MGTFTASGIHILKHGEGVDLLKLASVLKAMETGFEEENEVEAVRAHFPENATRYKTKKYLIKWKNYDDDENTWEDKKQIEGQIPELIDDYWKTVSKKKRALK